MLGLPSDDQKLDEAALLTAAARSPLRILTDYSIAPLASCSSVVEKRMALLCMQHMFIMPISLVVMNIRVRSYEVISVVFIF
jgi:hypothetical protein